MKQILVLAALITVFAVGLALALHTDPPDPAPQPPAAAPLVPPPAAVPDRPVEAVPDRRPPPLPSERQEVPVVAANPEAPQGVLGVAVDQRGAPLAMVRAFLVESANNDPIERFQNFAQKVSKPPVAAAVTGVDGVFKLGLRAATERSHEVYLLADGFADIRIGDLSLHADRWQDLGTVVLEQGSPIHGRVVVAGTDLPVPNATVTLESVYPLADVALADLPGAPRGRSAAVDAAGRYRIEHAPRSGSFRLLAAAPGFARVIRGDVELQPGQATEVDFQLQRELSIGGILLAADGQLVEGARIEAWPNAPEPAHLGTSAADGRFLVNGLPAGNYRLRVLTDRYQPREVADVAAGTNDLQIDLLARGSAALCVRTPDGQTLRNYHLAVRRFFAEGGGQIAMARDVPDRTIRLQADEELTVVHGLDPGTEEAPAVYAFQVRADGFAPTLSKPFAPTIGAPGPTVEMVMTRGGAIRGQVVDSQGRPIAGAAVTTQPAGAAEDNPVWRMVASLTPDRITRTTVTTDATGGFLLPRLAHADYQLDISHSDYCRCRRNPVRVDGDLEATIPPIVLPRGTLLSGRTLLDGRPRSQVRVVLTPEVVGAAQNSGDETTPLRVEAVSDPDGIYTLPCRIPPGRYEARAAVQVGGDPQSDLLQLLTQMQQSATTIVVLAGQETLALDILLQAR